MFGGPMDSIRIAKVVAVHPESYSVDLVFLDDGMQVAGAQLLSPTASTDAGLFDMPKPSPPATGDLHDAQETGKRDTYAVVSFLRHQPVVMGFLFPQVSQLLFDDMNRRVDRHASDVYTTIDGDGNFELFHPSGTYLRIGTAPAHEDLTGKDLDKKWAIGKNTDKAVHVHLGVSNAGSPVASLDIDPSGNVTLANEGNLTATVQGDVSLTAGGTAAVTSTGNMTLSAPQITLDTPLTIFTGIFTVENGGGAGTAGTVNGTLQVNDGDVLPDNISLKGQHHFDSQGDTSGSALP